MRFLLSARWLMLALVIVLISVSSLAGAQIIVSIAPPALPVYEQPPCVQPGMMWTPGYWAYSDQGYYWVSGAWVPAPYDGALWTPPYWGWEGGRYRFHEGYWGPRVGYYGGVNYGFGYGGFGFAGGEWRGHDFHYNTVVMHVDDRYIHHTFTDYGRVERSFVARDSHVAFSGGPGGIHHDPRPDERLAEHDQHQGRTSFQEHNETFSKNDKSSYANNNGGHPTHGSMGMQPAGSVPGNAGGGNLSGGGANTHAISVDNLPGSGATGINSGKNPTPIEGNSNGTGNSTHGSGGVGTHLTNGTGSSTGTTTGSTTTPGAGLGNRSVCTASTPKGVPCKETGTTGTSPTSGNSSGTNTGTTTGSTTHIGGSTGSNTHTQTNMSVTGPKTPSDSTSTSNSDTSSGSASPNQGSQGHGQPLACPSGQVRGSDGNCSTATAGPPANTGHGHTPTSGSTTGSTTGSSGSVSASGNTVGKSMNTGSGGTTSYTQTNMSVTPKTPGSGGAPNTPSSCAPGAVGCTVPIGTTPGNGNRGLPQQACTGGKVRDGGGNCVYPACPVAGTSRNGMGQCTCSGGAPPIQGHCGGKTPTTGTGTGTTTPHVGSGSQTGGQTIMPVTPHGNGAQPMSSHSQSTQSSHTQSTQPSHSGGAPSGHHR